MFSWYRKVCGRWFPDSTTPSALADGTDDHDGAADDAESRGASADAMSPHGNSRPATSGSVPAHLDHTVWFLILVFSFVCFPTN